jgi:hypothetical protein
VYQHKGGNEEWQEPAIPCARSTPYAQAKDELAEREERTRKALERMATVD